MIHINGSTLSEHGPGIGPYNVSMGGEMHTIKAILYVVLRLSALPMILLGPSWRFSGAVEDDLGLPLSRFLFLFLLCAGMPGHAQLSPWNGPARIPSQPGVFEAPGSIPGGFYDRTPGAIYDYMERVHRLRDDAVTMQQRADEKKTEADKAEAKCSGKADCEGEIPEAREQANEEQKSATSAKENQAIADAILNESLPANGPL